MEWSAVRSEGQRGQQRAAGMGGQARGPAEVSTAVCAFCSGACRLAVVGPPLPPRPLLLQVNFHGCARSAKGYFPYDPVNCKECTGAPKSPAGEAGRGKQQRKQLPAAAQRS